MMTGRGRWMTLPAMIGLFLGVLQKTPELSLLSLSVLLWLAAEWSLFCWRVRVELPRLQIERTVNGLSEPTGRLWAGRTATIVVKVTVKPGRFSVVRTPTSELAMRPDVGVRTTGRTISTGCLSPVVQIHDVVPENIEVLSRNHADQRLNGNQFELRFRTTAITLKYHVRVRAAGEVTLPGVRLRLQDAQGSSWPSGSSTFLNHFACYRPSRRRAMCSRW